jgi:hypothetical protein
VTTTVHPVGVCATVPPMFRILTRHWRKRAGLLVAQAYLLCVIAPPVALAFTDGKAAAHCLGDDHHVMAAVHVHADGTKHVHGASTPAQPAAHEHAGNDDHAKPYDHAMHDHGTAAHDHAQPAMAQAKADPQDEGNSTGGNCCGLFCLTAATFEMTPAIGIVPRASVLHPALQADVAGLTPARIDRPPNQLAS